MPDGRLAYKAHVGLMLNLERQELRRGFTVIEALKYAFGKRVPKKYFDATSASDAEASRRHFSENVARREAAAFATLGKDLPGRVTR